VIRWGDLTVESRQVAVRSLERLQADWLGDCVTECGQPLDTSRWRVATAGRGGMSRVRVVPFGSPLIGIGPYDATAHPTFAQVLERLQSTMRFSASDAYAVVTNHSPSAIEVLVMRWSMEEGGPARRKAKNVIHEGFSTPPYQPVLPPGASRLATGAGLLEPA
jgi:hypothetical protein